MENTIALLGNPNTGKTTLFNKLTKSFEHVGNWHGVTVDTKQSHFMFEGDKYSVVDLPGIYSLSAHSFEENISIEYLYKNPNATIFNICDANNLTRNLYLTLQLLEAGFNPIIIINFLKDLKRKNITLDINKLSKLLNVKVLCLDKNIKNTAVSALKIGPKRPQDKILNKYSSKINTDFIEDLIAKNCDEIGIDRKFCAIKLLEYDKTIYDLLNLTQKQKQLLSTHLNKLPDAYITIAKLRYEFIEQIISKCLISNKQHIYAKYKVDKIILNRFLSLPIFFCILGLIFFLTFVGIGSYFSDLIKVFINQTIGGSVNKFLFNINAPLWVVDMVNVCVINGVGGLVSFVPQIALLFLFLSILEDSGYMSRLAFSLEDIFKKVGLSGKSVFTLLMGFGCATSAVLTSRNLADKNAKIKTAIITPLMSCSAKLPLYAVLGGAFFGKNNIWLIFLMYVIGLVISLVMSIVLERTVLPSKNQSFMLEFAPYRLPNIKRIFKLILNNIKQFLQKITSIVFGLSVIIWILQNFTFKFQYIQYDLSKKSMLQVLCEILAPIFAPIGLNNWGIVASLIVGIVAKEMIVSTLSIINKAPSSNLISSLGATFIMSTSVVKLTPITAFVFMLFSLLYCPCLSTISVLNKEIGFKWTIFCVVSEFVLAYSVCLIVFNMYLLFTTNFTLRAIISIVTFAIIVLAITKTIKTFKTKSCTNCASCTKKCDKFNQ